MPLRILSYEGAAYKAQLTRADNAKVTSKRYPVVTLVLYFGVEHWNNNYSLKERVEVPEILEPYVNDYRINVREIAWLSDEQIASFKSDFRYVAEFFRLKRLKQDLKFDDKVPNHIDAILKLLTALSGDQSYQETINSEGGKPKTMCEVLDRMFKKKDDKIAELSSEIAELSHENVKLNDENTKLKQENEKLKNSNPDSAKIVLDMDALRAQLRAAGIEPVV